MERLITSTNMKKLLDRIIKKGLMKPEDLDRPPDGWFYAMGYDRCKETGKWIFIERTDAGARSMLPKNKLPKYKNPITGKITFDPMNY
tara:strand:+ start:82 stop:345 length:264 start_codon:yes stop_codon:yes gene_type:complete